MNVERLTFVAMRFRTYKNTDLTVSEVGFGLWTISTGWWGNFTEGEAIALMHKAFDLGITLFDAADTYGNGLSEELIAKAFPNQRDEIVIATKVGYDFVNHGEARGRGQREIPQDFSPEAIIRATDAALKRLKTDRIDLLQLHNIRMEQIYDDAALDDAREIKDRREDSLLWHRAWTGHWLALRGRELYSRTRRHECATHLQHARATSWTRYSRCGHRRRQGHNVSNSGDAFVWNARGKIHCRNNLCADRSSQSSAAQLAAQRRQESRATCDSWKIPSARLGRQHCNGCLPTIAWPRRCRTFTTKSSSLNSRKRRIVRRLQPTIWRGSTELYSENFGVEEARRSSREQWSCRKKRQPRESVARGALTAADREIGPRSAPSGTSSIRFVFFLHRLGAANFWLFASATLPLA